MKKRHSKVFKLRENLDIFIKFKETTICNHIKHALLTFKHLPETNPNNNNGQVSLCIRQLFPYLFIDHITFKLINYYVLCNKYLLTH